MASKKTLNAENLEALGAQCLAELLMDIAEGDAAVKRRLGLELAAKEAPETVAAKIVGTVQDLGLSRFGLKYSNGTLQHYALMRSIELYGTRVVPLVRAGLAKLASS